MNRRDFLKSAGAGSTALLVGGEFKPTKAATKPNIILFVTDDQDKHSIGAYGGNVLTPNLDRMAREGMTFHQSYVSTTVCTPSRYTMLTGRYAGRSTSDLYQEACPPGDQGYPSFNMELEDDRMNVGAVLGANGYVTGFVGKYHVGPEIKRSKDFEDRNLKYIASDAPADAATSESFRHNELWYREHMKKKGFSWAKNIYPGNLQKPFNQHNPEWTIDAALEFIEDNKDGPFYLHYSTTLVHGPNRSWRNAMDHPKVSGEGLLDNELSVMTDRKKLLDRLEEHSLDPLKGHAGYTWVDDSVGAVLDKLEELGIGDNTLLVFVSDHGSNMKASLYNKDGTNVPCMMRWPDGIKAGIECNELIQNIDFVPTFFDLAEARSPEGYLMDGRSLRPLFGGKVPVDWRDHLYFEIGAARAVCTQDWKYIAVRYTREQIKQIQSSRPERLPRNMAYIGRTGIGTRGSSNPNFFEPDQLYHVSSDPEERNNLSDSPEHRDRLEDMRALMKVKLESIGRPYGEFISGGNASPPGQIDEQLSLIKRIGIQGKRITLPDESDMGPDL